MDGIGSDRINTFLRQNFIQDNGKELGAFSTHSHTMKRICSVIIGIDSKLQPATKTKKVYRGVSAEVYNMMKQAGVFVNKGYTSTTTDINTALAFAQGSKRGVVLEFMIPVGMKIHKYNSYEKEILIERNTQFISFVEKTDVDGALLVETSIVKYSMPDALSVNNKTSEKARSVSIKAFDMSKLLEDLDAADDDLDWLHK
jgi:hypothetical protein